MYVRNIQDDTLKLYIGDCEYDLLPIYKQSFYIPYVRTTERPVSNFSHQLILENN
jgi:hypothetical protein